ncbi:putative bifunctional diguanylate cyclase/phosphodiesterase [Allohahella marinimesophila]|uniref:GGDEF domain-containing response regulator n=1 Tax=Allohahella marinimesophila TaxID=1054972 RepID=A0ABP7PQJ2_9GAMM
MKLSSTPTHLNILVVSTSPDLDQLQAQLHSTTVQVALKSAHSFAGALAEISSGQSHHAVLLDQHLAEGSGLTLLQHIRGISGQQIVIILSDADDLEAGLASLEAGAQDFIPRAELSVERLTRSILKSQLHASLDQKLQQSLANAQNLSERDSLTGLANRYLFDETLKVCLTNNRGKTTKLALFLFDLDRFKFINDSYGHVVGDRLLQQFASRMSTLLRPDEMFARLGGDEFALLVTNLRSDKPVSNIANRILRSLSDPFEIERHVLPVTTSIGIVVSPENGLSSEDLLKNADIAMYRAKKSGRNTFCFFSDDMQHHYHQQQTTELKLRQSIERNQFMLHYQPIVKCGEGSDQSIIGAEALLRWCEDGTTMRMPDKFLKVAEETGLMGAIGEWVIREACARLADIRAALDGQQRDEFCMSINVSPTQLTDGSVVLAIEEMISTYQLPPQSLELELTETAFVEDAGMIEKSINAIAALGCRIALDDFGTGYSSIQHLQRFPISTVKIDRCLMPDPTQTGLAGEPGAAMLSNSGGYLHTLALLKGLLAMLNSLQLTTTAEGVETEEHIKLCMKMGATRMQGWYYSKAVPFEEFMIMLGNKTCSRAT